MSKEKLLEHLLKNKTIYKRLMLAIIIIGIVMFFVIKDNSCSYKDFSCDSKGKFTIEVKK